jgi:hypothetical protein
MAPQEDVMTGKPTVEELGIDVAAQEWLRAGEGDGSIEVAFVRGAAATVVRDETGARALAGQHDPHGEWVLMRVAGDPEGRVLVYDRNEWECFLDGARKGEFQAAPE